jgi:hypothetical protein
MKSKTLEDVWCRRTENKSKNKLKLTGTFKNATGAGTAVVNADWAQ